MAGGPQALEGVKDLLEAPDFGTKRHLSRGKLRRSFMGNTRLELELDGSTALQCTGLCHDSLKVKSLKLRYCTGLVKFLSKILKMV